MVGLDGGRINMASALGGAQGEFKPNYMNEKKIRKTLSEFQALQFKSPNWNETAVSVFS